MNKILIAFVAATSLFTLGACKKKGGAGEAIAKVEEFSKKMCDCKDKACADKVNDEYTKWGAEMAKNAKPEDAKNVSAEDTKKMTDAATKYSECYTKLAMAGAGGGGSAAAGGDMAGSAAGGGSAAAGGDSGGSAAAGSADAGSAGSAAAGSAEEKK